MAGLSDEDEYWPAYRTKYTLQQNQSKFGQLFNKDFGGWEGWLQIELAVALYAWCNSEMRSTDHLEAHFSREQKIFQTNRNQSDARACDLLISTSITRPSIFYEGNWIDPSRPILEYHVVELKCRSGKEDLNAFGRRVEKDIIKIRDARPNELKIKPTGEWKNEVNARSGTGWVLAITLGWEGHDVTAAKMKEIELKHKITWHKLPLTNSGFATLWTWYKSYKGHPWESLFAEKSYYGPPYWTEDKSGKKFHRKFDGEIIEYDGNNLGTSSLSEQDIIVDDQDASENDEYITEYDGYH